MGSTRCKFEYSELRFPTMCPNCLTSPAGTPVSISRDSGVHWVSMGWPHCGACARDERWKQGRLALLKGSLVLCLSLTVVSVLIRFQGNLLSPLTTTTLGVAGLVLAGIMSIWTVNSIRRRPRPSAAPALGSGVRLIRGGTTLTGKQFLSLEFFNPDYATRFRELNGIG